MSLTVANIIISITILASQSYSFAVGLSSDGPTETQLDAREYCLRTTSESFQANCLKGEIIIIRSALYGRLRNGKCLKSEGSNPSRNLNDPQFLGCYLDVKEILSRRCFGRRSCEIHGTDSDLVLDGPCYSYLRLYLEVDYECKTVIEEERTCSVLATSKEQYIMPSSLTSTCGSRHQPWKLEAPAGQQINLSLLHFGGAVNQRDRECLQYGYIIDRSANRNVSMCASSNNSNQYIYTSTSNILNLVIRDELSSQNGRSNENLFAYLVQSVGCSNIVPPEDAWLSRNKNEAVIGCYSSRHTWKLTCLTNQWHGVIGNCTQTDSTLVQEEDAFMSDQSNFQNHAVIAIVSIIFTGMVICLLIICGGIICWKTYYAMNVSSTKRQHGPLLYPTVQPVHGAPDQIIQLG